MVELGVPGVEVVDEAAYLAALAEVDAGELVLVDAAVEQAREPGALSRGGVEAVDVEAVEVAAGVFAAAEAGVSGVLRQGDAAAYGLGCEVHGPELVAALVAPADGRAPVGEPEHRVPPAGQGLGAQKLAVRAKERRRAHAVDDAEAAVRVRIHGAHAEAVAGLGIDLLHRLVHGPELYFELFRRRIGVDEAQDAHIVLLGVLVLVRVIAREALGQVVARAALRLVEPEPGP